MPTAPRNKVLRTNRTTTRLVVNKLVLGRRFEQHHGASPSCRGPCAGGTATRMPTAPRNKVLRTNRTTTRLVVNKLVLGRRFERYRGASFSCRGPCAGGTATRMPTAPRNKVLRTNRTTTRLVVNKLVLGRRFEYGRGARSSCRGPCTGGTATRMPTAPRNKVLRTNRNTTRLGVNKLVLG